MSAELVTQPIIWIETATHLTECCALWQNTTLLAVDTEFMRSQTYYPIAGLIQINDGRANYLIDPVALQDLSPLVQILLDPNIVKAIHSCSEDLEVFHRLFATLPRNLFDTQIAAALTGYGFSVGFANLVKVALDVDLPKGETRSDWLQRPLSLAQINYAALDVEYLFPLATKLMDKLQQSQRRHWLAEECERLLDNFYDSQNPEISYLRNKTAWKLTPLQLAVLRGLSRWREETAQFRDVPRNRIIKEPTLFALAQQQPSELTQLRNFEGLTERMVRADGATILDIIRSNQQLQPEQLPVAVPRPLASSHDSIQLMREKVQAVADQLDIPSEMVARKKDYDALVRWAMLEDKTDSVPIPLSGWRQPLIGDLILEILNSLSPATFSQTNP